MIKRIGRLVSQREIIKNIVLKELKARYAGSLLGVFWAVISPLLIMGVISFIFTNVIKTEVENFPLFVLSAILPWMCFSTSLFDATPSIIRNSSLLNQFTICREILPISSVLVNYIIFCFGCVVILPIFIIFKIQILPFILIFPCVIFLQFLFTTGISLLLACCNVFFRDTMHILEVLLMFWFWLTPVFYSPEMIPLRFRWISQINPMNAYITMSRNILFEAKLPAFHNMLYALITALVALCAGYALFIRHEESFLKRV